MPVWCFLCDVPVEGDVCPRCGRPGTVVEDAPAEEGERGAWWEGARRIPRAAWLIAAVVAIVVLFAVLQSGFHLE
ncbi:MAG TPA: hypothetical protein VIY70_05870 [Acidimicrobiia bacterium]